MFGPISNGGLITIRKAKHAFVDPCELGCRFNIICFHLFLKTADVLSNGSGQELERLRQLAQVSPELLWIRSVQLDAVEANAAADRRKRPDQKTGQGGLTRCCGTSDTQRLSRLDLETDGAQYGRSRLARNRKNVRHDYMSFRSSRNDASTLRASRGSSARNRPNASLASPSFCQLAAANSIGASARPMMMDAPIITPGLSS